MTLWSHEYAALRQAGTLDRLSSEMPVRIAGGSGRQVLLTFLSRGDVVGEIALLDSLPPFGGGDGHAGLRTLPPLSVQV